jgi:hypothetical protein
MGLVAFRKLQMGLESTRGTSVAADKKLIGTLFATTDKPAYRPLDDRGSLAEFRRSVAVSQSTRLRYEGDATYEQLIHFLSMGLKGGVSPASTGSNRVWTFTPNLTSANSQNAYTFEFGDDQQEWECSFVMVENIELGVTLDEVVSLRVDMFGQYATKSTFTSLSDPVVNEIVANKLNVWIDGTYANLGSTAKDSLVVGATIRMSTGISPVKYADGSLDFSSFVEKRRHLEIDLDLLMNADGETEWDAFSAQTDRAIRLKFTGGVASAGENYYLEVNAFGQYTSPPELFTDRDGENVFRLTFASHEDSSGNEMSWSILNLETAL